MVKFRNVSGNELRSVLFFAKRYRPDITLSQLLKWKEEIVVIEERGEIVGCALCSFGDETFIHFVSANTWENLVELARFLLNTAFETGSTKIRTFTPTNQIDLQISLTKLGFEFEGRLRKSMLDADGRLIDVISMCKWSPTIPEIPVHTAEPLKFHIRHYRSEDYGKILELSTGRGIL